MCGAFSASAFWTNADQPAAIWPSIIRTRSEVFSRPAARHVSFRFVVRSADCWAPRASRGRKEAGHLDRGRFDGREGLFSSKGGVIYHRTRADYEAREAEKGRKGRGRKDGREGRRHTLTSLGVLKHRLGSFCLHPLHMYCRGALTACLPIRTVLNLYRDVGLLPPGDGGRCFFRETASRRRPLFIFFSCVHFGIDCLRRDDGTEERPGHVSTKRGQSGLGDDK
ncbi:hypothetical protein DFH11DRAFT_383428 [Phellopilus nigrolimitatus]|nr:hypothetical protein DFH11DRAFT_383428 [Phellopilus nigrolimitatus]